VASNTTEHHRGDFLSSNHFSRSFLRPEDLCTIRDQNCALFVIAHSVIPLVRPALWLVGQCRTLSRNAVSRPRASTHVRRAQRWGHRGGQVLGGDLTNRATEPERACA
jgi:hypothetical protein